MGGDDAGTAVELRLAEDVGEDGDEEVDAGEAEDLLVVAGLGEELREGEGGVVLRFATLRFASTIRS